jgi:hypothetical protein
MTDEGDAEFSIDRETGFMRLSAARCNGRVTHQTRKLSSALAKGRITKRLFDHPVLGATGVGADPMLSAQSLKIRVLNAMRGLF